MLVAEVLEDSGYHVLEAADGPSGLSLLESSMPIDLPVTDVGLPGGLNGRQLANAAREVRPDLRVLFITGYAEHAVIGDGQLDTGMALLTKPFPIETLSLKVSEMLSKAVA